MKRPANITKRTGCGCSCFGVATLAASSLAIGAFLLTSGSGFLAFGITGIAVGGLICLAGMGLLVQSRRVDRLLSGEDLIASWTYPMKNNKEGHVFIGDHGIYHNGVHTEWNSTFTLEEVLIPEDRPDTLVFQILIVRNNSQLGSSPLTRSRRRIPIPEAHMADALRVVAAYRGSGT